MIEEIGDRGDLGTFVMQIDLMYPFAAHLQEFERTGKVRSVIRDGLARYYWS
jgi:hypothetical protein